jgi:uncharacterized protein YcfL
MKKVLVVLSAFALLSCGGGQSTEVVTDSVSVDSSVVVDTVVVPVDTAVSVVPNEVVEEVK